MRACAALSLLVGDLIQFCRPIKPIIPHSFYRTMLAKIPSLAIVLYGLAQTVNAGVSTFTVEGQVCTDGTATVTYESTVGVDSATKTVTAPASETAIPSDWREQILDETNAKRALQQDTAPLSWSSALEQYAQAYADAYACDGTLTHSGGRYGENLAIGYSPAGAVDAWYNEIADYDFSHPDFSKATGHFTQLVWKDTTQVGCGIKYCGEYYGDYVVCSYNPPGNYEGEFADQVGALK